MAGYRIGEKNRAKIEKDPQLRSLICLHCGYLSKDPTVLTCGHRFCRTCVESVRVLGSFVTVACPIDGHYVKLEECHQDKLAITQINNLVMSCEIKTCTWHGKVWHLEDHMKDFHNSHKEECAKNLHQDGELKRLRQEQQEAARKIMGIEEMLRNQDVTIHNIRRQLSAFSDAFMKVQGHGQLDNKEILTGSDEPRQQLNTFKHKVQTLEEQNLHQDGELKRLRQEQQEAARKIMGIEEMLRNQDVTIHNIRRQLSAFSDAFMKVQGHGQLDNKEILTGSDELRQQLNTFKHKVQTLEEQNLHQNGELKRLRQEQQEAARKIMGIEEMEKSTGNVELRQQLSTLQHKVQTLEEQLRVQKDQCGKYHVECVAESGRTCEERNIEVEILQGSISCLTKQLVDVQNKYVALQTSHANLQHRLDALQAQFAFS